MRAETGVQLPAGWFCACAESQTGNWTIWRPEPRLATVYDVNGMSTECRRRRRREVDILDRKVEIFPNGATARPLPLRDRSVLLSELKNLLTQK